MKGDVSFRVLIQRSAHWMTGQLDTVTSYRMFRLWPFRIAVIVAHYDPSKFVRPTPSDGDRCPYCSCGSKGAP